MRVFYARKELAMICCFYLYNPKKYLDFLLDGHPILNLPLKLHLNLFSFRLILLLVLVEVLYILLQNLIAFFESVISVLRLFFQIGYLLLDNLVRHGHQKHFLLLF